MALLCVLRLSVLDTCFSQILIVLVNPKQVSLSQEDAVGTC